MKIDDVVKGALLGSGSSNIRRVGEAALAAW